MARKGWTERLKELGKDTRAELDKSRQIMDRISEDEPKKKEQDGNTIGTLLITEKEHHRNRTGTPKEHQKGVTVTPLFDQKEQDRNTKGTPLKKNRIGTPFKKLPRQQYKVYNWFISRGYKGTFNKALIMRETGIAYHTIRKALWKFESIGLISVNYDKSVKEFEYNIDQDIEVTGPSMGQKGTVLEQEGNTKGTPSLIEEEDNIYYLLLDQVTNLYGNLDAIGFEKSQLQQIVNAWKAQGIDLKYLPLSLERADWAVEHKTIKADDPLAYVYKSLMRGQFAKPPKFQSRAEVAQASADPEEMKAVSAKLKGRLKAKG